MASQRLELPGGLGFAGRLWRSFRLEGAAYRDFAVGSISYVEAAAVVIFAGVGLLVGLMTPPVAVLCVRLWYA